MTVVGNPRLILSPIWYLILTLKGIGTSSQQLLELKKDPPLPGQSPLIKVGMSLWPVLKQLEAIVVPHL